MTAAARVIAGTKLALVQGDIAAQSVEAVVNAANSGLLGGGGVDGAIHRTGGPEIMAECDKIRDTEGGCATGQAVLTGAGQLAARYVLHAVGPIWRNGNEGEPALLRSAYESCLKIVRDRAIRTVAFPSLSTGAYRFPIAPASRIALATVVAELRTTRDDDALEEVRFVLFSATDFAAYCAALEELPEGES